MPPLSVLQNLLLFCTTLHCTALYCFPDLSNSHKLSFSSFFIIFIFIYFLFCTLLCYLALSYLIMPYFFKFYLIWFPILLLCLLSLTLPSPLTNCSFCSIPSPFRPPSLPIFSAERPYIRRSVCLIRHAGRHPNSSIWRQNWWVSYLGSNYELSVFMSVSWGLVVLQ